MSLIANTFISKATDTQLFVSILSYAKEVKIVNSNYKKILRSIQFLISKVPLYIYFLFVT